MAELIDTFTFVTEGDRIRIYQHYKSVSEAGAISTPIGYFSPGSGEVEWTCTETPACLHHLWKNGALGAQRAATTAISQYTGDLALSER